MESSKKSIFALDSDEETENNSTTPASSSSALKTQEPQQDFCSEDKVSEIEEGEEEVSKLNGSNDEEEKSTQELTSFQKAKIERNRQRALLLRQARLQAHPYKSAGNVEHSVIRVQNSRLIDTGGGFLIEEKDLEEEKNKEIIITEEPPPILLPERPMCLECQEPLYDSFLYRSFSYSVCDSCRDEEEKHMLITKTDARQEFLLKDCDLDLREPILKFILRKNPHNPRWGEMKLYLRLQVEKRAMEIWETPEKLEEEREIRENKREKSKVNKFNKQVKALRMAVRSSVYKKPLSGHQHVYGEEEYDAEKDMYYRSCTTCEHQQIYEKM